MPDRIAIRPAVDDYAHGISAVDSGYLRPRLDAIHLIIQDGRAAVVDAGTNASIPLVLEALRDKGIAPDAIDFVMLTHVHLDHAGGAGLLMREAPNAKLVVHPRGARHMIDPSKLMAATKAVYGAEATERMYGTILPVPGERVLEADDGAAVALADRVFTFHDTPGHARHHNCIHDEVTGHLFTGDMFGLSYREFDRDDGRQFVFPATTPTQFDPDAFHASIDRMMALAPAALYLTHYGQVGDVPRIAADLLRLVDAHAALARDAAGIPDPMTRLATLKVGIHDIATEEARIQGWGGDVDDVLSMDMALNADGLQSWIESGGATPAVPGRSRPSVFPGARR